MVSPGQNTATRCLATSQAAAVLLYELTANSSCSSLVMPYLAAVFSAQLPCGAQKTTLNEPGKCYNGMLVPVETGVDLHQCNE